MHRAGAEKDGDEFWNAELRDWTRHASWASRWKKNSDLGNSGVFVSRLRCLDRRGRQQRSRFLKRNSSMLECQRLTKRFDERLALDALDLRVGGGEIFCLLGANGEFWRPLQTPHLVHGLLNPANRSMPECSGASKSLIMAAQAHPFCFRPDTRSMKRHSLPLGLLLLLPVCAFAASPAGTSASSASSAASASSDSSSGDDKVVLDARDDAASFVASEGRIRGARLEAALIQLRVRSEAARSASDMVLARAILAR